MDDVAKLVLVFLWFLVAFFFTLAAIEMPGCTSPKQGMSADVSDIVIYDAPDLPAPDETGMGYTSACIKYDYYFCPPLDQIWQAVVETDICQDPPVILSISECFEVWECDPSAPNLGEEVCFTADGYPGTSAIYCDKGEVVSGPCESDCFEEICDYEDNDCDGQKDEGLATAWTTTVMATPTKT